VEQPTFSHLLSPGRIGSLDLSSRVLMPAMDMNLCDDGHITDAEVRHYTARAAGGAAMVITGSGAVAFPVGATSRHQPGLSHDRFLPGLERLAASVHAVGGRVCIQLCHHGKVAGVDTADGRPLLVPSVPVPGFALDALVDSPIDELMGLATATQGKRPSYRVADDADLAEVVEQFADAAARVQRAGCDAVEIHAAHGYLLSTFLSPAYNHRTDQWGGSAEHRARLTTEVVRAVKARLGPEFPVLVRINGREFGIDGGLDASTAAEVAPFIAAAGADAIHVSANAHNPFGDFTDGPLPSEVGSYRLLARAVKHAVDIPVVAVGRVVPELADEMLAAGDCDFVSMGRQQLADPDLVAKIRAGHRHRVRPCINCYVCVEQNFFDAPPKCAVNPALGNETRLASVTAMAVHPRHVVVVGAGPAGMEVARLAAGRGHRVTVLERSARVGGTAGLSRSVGSPTAPFLDWQEHAAHVAGVEVRMGVDAAVSSVAALVPDVVVLATGAGRQRPDVPGVDAPHVIDIDGFRALFEQGGLPGNRVVVLGGSLVGLEVARVAAGRGCAVTVLEPGAHLGRDMAMPRRWAVLREFARVGATAVRAAAVQSIDVAGVTYDHADERHRVPADLVVLSGLVAGDEASASLADGLAAEGIEVRRVGDAAACGYIEGAIRSAWQVAEEI
jgi:2,4-dienoyl-CoA reductase-like NADH-dependent reductase (Old Yellow Enzyme family)/thioredoxin reductase